jgi:2-succinyl-5-enolpyruvyl-6-hydroxy-3-cyclohexene-1-carboxylate synthase
MNPALAEAVAAACRGAGVDEFCLCAGARNSDLVAVLVSSAAEGPRVFQHFDERAAGFFVLGRSRASGRPVAVVTTSGTAVAELLPAAVEAYYQGVPLLLVTADRPRRFAGTGAPQAIEQVGLFSAYVEAWWDVAVPGEVKALADSWTRQRPAHLNVRFEEPGSTPPAAGVPLDPPSGRRSLEIPLPNGPARIPGGPDPAAVRRWVVLVGDLPELLRAPVTLFAAAFGAPVWAEATSGLREAPRLAHLRVCGGERSLRDGGFDGVLRLGGVPSCRFWRDLEERADVAVVSAAATGGWPGLARPSHLIDTVGALAEAFGEAGPSDGAFRPNDDARALGTDSLLEQFPQSEPALVRELSLQIPRGSLVFLGNSLPLREWNTFATWEDRDLRCFANRGANGIDGLLSTFFGLAADEPESWAVIGDLSTLYDLDAPWVATQLPPGRRRIVVINNGGGKIFSRLPALRGLPDRCRAVIENRHQTGFGDWARQWSWGYHQAERPDEFPDPGSLSDHAVIELRPDRGETEAFWAAYETP